MPTIAHVLHRLYLAGAEVLAAALARELRGRYTFIFFCLDEIGPLGRQLAAEGFTVVDLQRRPGLDLAVARRMRRLVREHGVRLLHAHQYTPFFYAAASRGIGGLVTGEPRLLFTEHGRHYPDVRKRRRVWANKLLLRPRDRVTAVGRFVKQALATNEGIDPPRIEVVYNGIDEAAFDVGRDAALRGQVRGELGIDGATPVLLHVARFHPVKDHATGLRGFALAVRRMRDGNAAAPLLLLVGDGEKMGEAEALAGELGVADRVRFLGVRTDVPRLMAAADAFMLSSLSEGVSVTLLEAMAARLPIAATDVGGNEEVVADGVAGLLSPRGDHEALGRHLSRLLSDAELRYRLGDAGRQRVLETFTQQQMHTRYASIYEAMLNE